GGTYKLMWVPGSYASECYFKFTTEGDSVIVEHASGSSPSSDLLATFTVAYVAAKKPTNLQASDVTYNSATLTWTPGSEDQDTWIVAYFGENDTESTTEPVSENPTLTLTNLQENTTYTAVVYASVDGELSQPSDAVVFKTPEQFPTPTNLEVTELNAKSAVVEWTGEAETYNLRYRKCNVLFFDGFENGLDNWTLVDSDKDGKGWQILEPSTWNGDGYEYSAYEGVNVAMSRSWQNNNALTPDNWLISPKVDLGETLEYYISDDGEYQETYRVYVSVTGNEVDDFVPLTDDLLSPGSQTWIKRSHDLSAYNGQSGYIAFRQYNCTDEDYMWIDAVTIKGTSNEEWTTVEGIEKDVYILEDLEPETDYEVQVQANYGEDTSNWSASLEFRTPSATTLPKIEGVDTGRDWAEVSWNGTQESYNLRYRTAPLPGGFYEPFENGVPDTWTTIDNDGDGYNWTNRTVATDNAGNPTGFGDGCVTSASYYNGTALYPDNWLVTPQVELSGTLSVWLRGQDPSYAAEHFAIYVSTTGNTVNDFLASDDNILVAETEAEGVLTEYTADLSSFNGATGYVAIRHFNCSDQFYLNVDNFHISSAPDIPAGDWVLLEGVDSPYLIEGLEAGTEYEVEVQGVVDDETTTDWVSTTFTTQSASFMTLAEILENGVDEQSYKLDGDLYMVAQTNYDGNLMTYVTDNEGNWARVYGLTAAQFANYNTLIGLAGTLYFLDTAPTFVPTAGQLTTTDIDVEIRNIDLTQAVELPQACEVVNITGYFDGEKIRAYSGQNGEMGQGILLASTSDGDLDFDEGTQIDVQLAIELREPWENAAPLPGPRRIAPTDPDALDNIVGNVVSSQETPIETGITTINGDRKNNGEVRYYDINGRYVGKNLEGVDKGIYIGTDGTKVRK
ncbi:MAG: choice-of-anchor J domain-containing protein, partial [Muribaculaceae bacterium]|nr:choice-of-anchor J domain-containing protein [Muribaculaceae bacterium]